MQALVSRLAREQEGRRARIIGLAMILAGVLVLAGVGAYYGYGVYARTGLDGMSHTVDMPVSLPAFAADDGFIPVDAVGPDPSPRYSQASSSLAEVSPPGAAETTDEPTTMPAAGYGLIYPASWIHPKYWRQPLWAGSDPYPDEEAGFPDGFQALSASDSALSRGSAPVASRLVIPSIDVDSAVRELRILDLGDSRAYETPDNVVGHIPETANPGETGNGWFFGHLESRLLREGDVFRRLPEISQLLKDGESVYVKIVSGEAEYLYQVTGFSIVHQDDLALYGSGDSIITLVTCYPALYYDHRVLVTAELVGFRG